MESWGSRSTNSSSAWAAVQFDKILSKNRRKWLEIQLLLRRCLGLVLSPRTAPSFWTEHLLDPLILQCVHLATVDSSASDPTSLCNNLYISPYSTYNNVRTNTYICIFYLYTRKYTYIDPIWLTKPRILFFLIILQIIYDQVFINKFHLLWFPCLIFGMTMLT